MTTKKLTKLLALYLPYILLGLVTTNLGEVWRLAEGKELGDNHGDDGNFPGGICEPSAQSASAGFAYWLFLRRRTTACRIFAEQKCKEVQARHGVRLCPMGPCQGH